MGSAPASVDAHGVESPADDMVANSRKVLHAPASDEDDRVFLKVVSHARDVGRNLDPVREPDARDFT